MTPIQQAELAHLIADRAVICDIECSCVPTTGSDGIAWWDTRVMIDPREMPDTVIEMNRQALDYATQRGLISRNTDQPHMVRINTRKRA